MALMLGAALLRPICQPVNLAVCQSATLSISRSASQSIFELFSFGVSGSPGRAVLVPRQGAAWALKYLTYPGTAFSTLSTRPTLAKPIGWARCNVRGFPLWRLCRSRVWRLGLL